MMKKTNIWVSVIIASILLFMTGCGKIQDKVNEKVSEGIVGKAVGANVDITKDGLTVQKDGATFQSGNDLKWPKSSMGDLPEPKAKITGLVVNEKNNGGGTVIFSEMSLDDAKAYVEKLKGLGYKDGTNFSDANGLSYGGVNSGGAAAVITYNASPKEGTIEYATAEANKSN